jgi:competence protein ComEC
VLLLKNLKISLLFKLIYVGFVFFSLIYTTYILKNELYFSKYSGEEQKLVGYIKNIKIDGNKVSINLGAKEEVIVTYYLKSKEEKEIFTNNYLLGDYIEVEGVMKVPSKNRVFNLFNYQKYLLSQKIYWLFNSDAITKISNNKNKIFTLKNKMITRINKNKDTSDYLKAFILGDKSEIDSVTLKNYQTNGINHLFAISGMHITLLSIFILKGLSFINKRIKLNYIATIILLIFYLILIGFQPSAMRATFLFILLTINKYLNLKIKTIYYLLFLVSVLLLVNPFYVYNLGFVFSFVISFYLIVFQNIINKHNNYITKILTVSLISFLASIPILINNFFQINLLSPVINIIFVPYVSFLLFPLSILVYISPLLNNILIISIKLLENISLFFSNINMFIVILKKVPILVLIIYYLIITLLLVQLQKNRYYPFTILFIGLLFHNNYEYFNKYPILSLIDVGQGDSILIQLPYKQGNILIDTGGILKYNKENWEKSKKEYSLASDLIIPYIKSLGVKKIDYLVITHGDNDHIGEANELVNNYKVRNVILNSGYNNKSEMTLIENSRNLGIKYYHFDKDILTVGNYKFYFLNDVDQTNENEDSLIIYTKLNDKNILLMGDAGKISEKYIISEYKLPKMDILKVGHHGSKYSTSDELLEVIKPELALISVGANNRFNHPHEEVIDKLGSYNIKYVMTSINGTIKLIIKNKITIYTCL